MVSTLKVSTILTAREMDVISKKLRGKRLGQQDSNYLSRYVRPKLKEIALMDAQALLNKLNYNQKATSIEANVKKIILKDLGKENVAAIVLYGSAIRTNYTEYNDIDIMVIVRKKFWASLGEKYRKITEIKSKLEKIGIIPDVEIYDKPAFKSSLNSNVSLVYQLKDSKVIYGKLEIPENVTIPKLALRMKADYSVLGRNASSLEIYRAIRNVLLVMLAMNKMVDNAKLSEAVNEEIGKSLVYKLKTDTESPLEKKIALLSLGNLLNKIIKNLKEAKWEKIELSSR